MIRNAIFTLVILALVASTGAVLAQDGVTLRLSSFQSGAVVEKWEEQWAEFEEMTGIKVVHEFVPWQETVERYLTMAAGDDLPDVALISAQWNRTLATRGVLAELTQDQFEAVDFDDYWPRLLAAYNYDGVQYVLPADLDLQLIYYNKDIFDAAGVAYPEAGWTWDDYRATAMALTEGGSVGKIYGSNDIAFGETRMITWSYGGDFIDAETGEAMMDSEPVQRALGLLAAMMVEDESTVLPGAEGVTIDRVAMSIYGPLGLLVHLYGCRVRMGCRASAGGHGRSCACLGQHLGRLYQLRPSRRSSPVHGFLPRAGQAIPARRRLGLVPGRAWRLPR